MSVGYNSDTSAVVDVEYIFNGDIYDFVLDIALVM